MIPCLVLFVVVFGRDQQFRPQTICFLDNSPSSWAFPIGCLGMGAEYKMFIYAKPQERRDGRLQSYKSKCTFRSDPYCCLHATLSPLTPDRYGPYWMVIVEKSRPVRLLGFAREFVARVETNFWSTSEPQLKFPYNSSIFPCSLVLGHWFGVCRALRIHNETKCQPSTKTTTTTKIWWGNHTKSKQWFEIDTQAGYSPGQTFSPPPSFANKTAAAKANFHIQTIPLAKAP